MIDRRSLSVEPWAITESELHLDVLPQTETIFALSNGHLGLRGNLDEGEPHHVPGTYLNGYFESLPLPYAEAGYGYPEEGQSLINVTDGKLMHMLMRLDRQTVAFRDFADLVRQQPEIVPLVDTKRYVLRACQGLEEIEVLKHHADAEAPCLART